MFCICALTSTVEQEQLKEDSLVVQKSFHLFNDRQYEQMLLSIYLQPNVRSISRIDPPLENRDMFRRRRKNSKNAAETYSKTRVVNGNDREINFAVCV